VGTLSLRMPVDLGVEHQVNFEVNLQDFGQSDFLEIWGSVELSHKSLDLKSCHWRHYGFMGNLKDVLDCLSS